MLKPILFVTGAMLVSVFVWWCSGFNFDVRGEQAFFCASTALGSGLFGYVLSRLEEL